MFIALEFDSVVGSVYANVSSYLSSGQAPTMTVRIAHEEMHNQCIFLHMFSTLGSSNHRCLCHWTESTFFFYNTCFTIITNKKNRQFFSIIVFRVNTLSIYANMCTLDWFVTHTLALMMMMTSPHENHLSPADPRTIRHSSISHASSVFALRDVQHMILSLGFVWQRDAYCSLLVAHYDYLTDRLWRTIKEL